MGCGVVDEHMQADTRQSQRQHLLLQRSKSLRGMPLAAVRWVHECTMTS